MRILLLSCAVLSFGCVGLADPALVTAPLNGSDAGEGGSDGGTDAGNVDAGVSADAGRTAIDGGLDPCAAMTCTVAGARCDGATLTCVCAPGYVGDGTVSCAPMDAGVPETRTAEDVCSAWRTSQIRRQPGDGFSASADSCDPGTLNRGAIDDALARLNFYRWLSGVGPTLDDAPGGNSAGQDCAVIAAWNEVGPAAHFPGSTATCYSPGGASAAGGSNIAWGASSAADAIDLWMIDFGNESTFGHRRWLLNPPLSQVGLGHYRGGNNLGTAACMSIFGRAGTGPQPEFLAFPPPGFSPTPLAQWHWTVHGNIPLSGMAVTVTRLSDGAVLPTRLGLLNGSYGQAAVAILRESWSPVAGQTYHVKLTGMGGLGTIEYDVKPTDCP